MPVGIVPAQLAGDKILQPRLVHHLRQVGRIAECIGQPDRLGVNTKLFDVETAAAHDLPDQRLARDDIDVRLHPHGALNFELARFDAFLETAPDLRIVLLEKVEQYRLVVHKDELWILLHQVEHRGKAAARLVAGMHHAPEPADIEVGRSDRGDLRLQLGIDQRIDLSRNGFGIAQ